MLGLVRDKLKLPSFSQMALVYFVLNQVIKPLLPKNIKITLLINIIYTFATLNMTISKYIEPISECRNLSIKLLVEEFGIDEDTAIDITDKEVMPHFNKLKDSCYLLAETPYVDKVFRNSYYHYYSSKHKINNRDCIKISIFENEIIESDFTNPAKKAGLQNRYRGFVILRPITPFVVGRNAISPKALKENTFLSCYTTVETTANGIKFKVDAFPHSSQDTETISCAETTLWAIMEYFGNKYSDYLPVLPSRIIQVLKEVTSERQLPTNGLTIQQISFALRQFGFGSIIYSQDSYGIDFKKLLRTYLESGIPLICGIDNTHIKGGDIGHAVICVGRDQISDSDIDALPISDITNASLKDTIAANGYIVYDWGEVNKPMIFVDDNYPVYQRAFLDHPTIHYSTRGWQDCTIKHFIVPLYSKIYLEAYQAKNFVFKFLMQGPVPLITGTEVLIRFFLSSSRSFKDSLSLKQSFQTDIRDIILELPMPKFIWVAELSNKTLMKERKANGLIILDATEANVSNNKPLIVAAYQNHFLTPQINGVLEDTPLMLSPYKTYTKNLKNL